MAEDLFSELSIQEDISPYKLNMKETFYLSVKTTTYGGGGVWGQKPHSFGETVLPLSQIPIEKFLLQGLRPPPF